MELRPLDFARPSVPSTNLAAYVTYYSLTNDQADHFIGTFKSGADTLVAQVFKPVGPSAATATVILAHGYYDHTGVWKHVIRHLVRNGFVVATFDQPGHGLSSGEPAAIGTFAEYSAALRQFVALCRQELPGPQHLVAHSMGCAVALDCLLTPSGLPVQRIVFLAPLVRSAAWTTSGLGFRIGRPIVDSVPRRFRKNSSDPEFLEFHKNDPLQASIVPFSWVAAHRAWHDKIQKAKPTKHHIKVIQGTDDSTVDWKYNLRFLRRKVPQAEITRIEDAGHQLMNESEPLRTEVLELTVKYLRNP